MEQNNATKSQKKGKRKSNELDDVEQRLLPNEADTPGE